MLPPDLLTQFGRGNCALFTGPRLADPARGRSGLPSQGGLARIICERLNVPDQMAADLPYVAWQYEYAFDRATLVRCLADQLNPAGFEPLPAHEFVAQLPAPIIFTVTLDRLLERACARHGRACQPIVRGDYAARIDAAAVPVVYLNGHVEQPNRLVVTQRDHEQTRRGLELPDQIKAHLASNTVLMLGCDLADATFRQDFQAALSHVDRRYEQRIYAVYQRPDAFMREVWADLGVEILEVDATDFLEALLAAIGATRATFAAPAGRAAPQAPQRPKKRPWKALDYYEESDTDLFFGRETEVQELLSRIASHRFTVLHSPSGAGKTSLLNAGVIPALRHQNYRVAPCRVSSEPIAALRTAIRNAWPEARSTTFQGTAQAADWYASDARVALDHGARVRLQTLLTTRFNLEELRELIADMSDALPALRYEDLEGGLATKVRALIGFLERRGDFALLGRVLYERPDLQDDIRQLFAPLKGGVERWLDALDQIRFPDEPPPPLVVICDEFEKFFLDTLVPDAERKQFVAEVLNAIKRADLPIRWVFSLRKEAVCDLFTYFDQQSNSLAANLRRLDPLSPEQAKQAIVGPAQASGIELEGRLVERLLEDLVQDGAVDPPQLQIVCDALYDLANARRTNRVHLSDYERASGATAILQDYLTRVLDRFSPRDVEIVKTLLIELAGAQETTLALNLTTLAGRLERTPEQVAGYLQRLKNARVIREMAAEGRTTYELTHTYLIKEINSWVGAEALALKSLQAIAALGARAWEQGVRLPLPVEALDLIFPHRAVLRLATEERRLIWHFATLHGSRIREWCSICRDEDEQLSILQADPALPRPHVLEALRWIGTAAAAQELTRTSVDDPDPAIRRLAAEQLAEIDGSEAQTYLIEQARALARPKRIRHERAIAILRDRDKLRERLDPSLRLGVNRELVLLRLGRNMSNIAYLVTGAALGLLPILYLTPEPVLLRFYEVISMMLALGIGIGQALSMRHRHLSMLIGVMICGALGGLLAGILAVFIDAPEAFQRYISQTADPFGRKLALVWLIGGIGSILGGIIAAGLILITWRKVSWRRRSAGFILGSFLAGAAVISLAYMFSSTKESFPLIAFLESAGGMALVGVGMSLGEYVYQRSGARLYS